LEIISGSEDYDADAAEQVEQADDGQQQRAAEDDAARRRQLHREGDEQDAHLGDEAPVPRHLLHRVGVAVAGEELVRVAGVAGEQPLQILGGQILGVVVEEVREPGWAMGAVHNCSRCRVLGAAC